MNFKSPRSVASFTAIGLILVATASAQNATIDFTNCTNPSTVWTSNDHGCYNPGAGTKSIDKLPEATQAFNVWVDQDSGATVTPESFVTNPGQTGLAAGVTGNVWRWNPGTGSPAPGIDFAGSGKNETGTVLVSDSGSSFELLSFELEEDKTSSVAAKIGTNSHPAYPVTYTVLFCSGESGCTSLNDLGSWTGTLTETSSTSPVFTLESLGGCAGSNCGTDTNNYSGYAESMEVSIDAPGAGNVYLDTIDIHVPEGGAASLYLLLAGAACFSAMFFMRNQVTA